MAVLFMHLHWWSSWQQWLMTSEWAPCRCCLHQNQRWRKIWTLTLWRNWGTEKQRDQVKNLVFKAPFHWCLTQNKKMQWVIHGRRAAQVMRLDSSYAPLLLLFITSIRYCLICSLLTLTGWRHDERNRAPSDAGESVWSWTKNKTLQ